MNGTVLILSADRMFARMLEIEFSAMGYTVTVAEQFPEEQAANVILLDLDTVKAPEFSDRGGILIGFTRELTAVDSGEGRRCSRILHRPFEMKLIREEIKALLADIPGKTAGTSVPRKQMPEWHLQKEPPALLAEGKRIPLSPQEFAVAECLAQKRGEPVSREELSERIGSSSANKTDVYICLLRRKTAELFGGIPWIRTVRGKGYTVD